MFIDTHVHFDRFVREGALPELMRAATKGVVHRNTASRKVSRLSQRIKAIGA